MIIKSVTAEKVRLNANDDLNLDNNLLGPLMKDIALKNNLLQKLNLIKDTLINRSITNSCQFTTPEGIPIIAYQTKDKILLFGTVYYNYLGAISNEFEILEIRNEKAFGYEIDISSLLKEIKFRKKTRCRYIYSFGTTQNFGHYIWNECTAMHFLVETNLINSFDKIYIGKYDYLDIAGVLKNRGLKVTSRKPVFKNLESFILLKTAALTFSNNCRNFILNSRNISTKPINIAIQIRTGNRSWTNTPIEFAELIQSLHIIFPDVHFVIDGYSTIKSMRNSDIHEIESDLKFVEAILKCIPGTIRVETTVGKSFKEKLELLASSMFVIGPIGSGNIIANWLLNKPLICFGPPNYYEWTKHDAENLVYTPRSPIYYFPHEELIFDKNGSYRTNMKALLQFIVTSVKPSPPQLRFDICEYYDFD